MHLLQGCFGNGDDRNEYYHQDSEKLGIALCVEYARGHFITDQVAKHQYSYNSHEEIEERLLYISHAHPAQRGVPYRYNISNVNRFVVLMRMAHVAVYGRKNTMSTPRGYYTLERKIKKTGKYLHIRRPKLRGRAVQSRGHRYVGMGSLRLPGASGFQRPSMKTMPTTNHPVSKARS